MNYEEPHMTEPLPLNVGRRRCRGCKKELASTSSVFRCPDCVLKSIDRHRLREDQQ